VFRRQPVEARVDVVEDLDDPSRSIRGMKLAPKPAAAEVQPNRRKASATISGSKPGIRVGTRNAKKTTTDAQRA